MLNRFSPLGLPGHIARSQWEVGGSFSEHFSFKNCLWGSFEIYWGGWILFHFSMKKDSGSDLIGDYQGMSLEEHAFG